MIKLAFVISLLFSSLSLAVTPWVSLVTRLAPTHWYRCNEVNGAGSLVDSGGTAVALAVRTVVAQGASTLPVGSSVAGSAAGDTDPAILWDGVRGAKSTQTQVVNNFSIAFAFKPTVATQQGAMVTCNGNIIEIDDGAGAVGNKLSVVLALIKFAGNSGAVAPNVWHFAILTRAAGVLRLTLDGVAITLTDTTTAPNSNSVLGIGGDFINGSGGRWPFTGAMDEVLIFNGGALSAANEALLYQTWVKDRTIAGRVQYTAAAGVGVSGANLTAITNGDITDGMAVATGNTYVGLDLGVAVPVDTVALANPQGAQIANQAGHVNTAISIYGSATDPNVSGVPTVLTTIINTIVDDELNLFTVSGAYRYVSLPLTLYDANKQYLNEIQVYGPTPVPASSTYQPMRPVMTPPPGRYPAATVTLSSPTTSALIFYTTDGTTPTTASTLYTAQIVVAATETIKAIAYDPTSGNSSYVASALYTIASTQFDVTAYLTDEQGNRAQLHAGHVMWDAATGKYWGYGMWMRATTTGLSPTYVSGIKVYSSMDLVNWKSEGWAWRESVTNQFNNLTVEVQRAHILRNPNTGQYVMWVAGVALQGSPTSQFGCMVLTSPTPAGPFTLVHDNGAGTGMGNSTTGYYMEDSSLFQDTDGTGYLISHVGDKNNLLGAGGTAGMMIFRLSRDYLSIDGINSVVLPLAQSTREAPVLFKRNGIYFFLSSVGNFYNSSLSMDVRYLVGPGSNPIAATWAAPDGNVNGTLAYSGDPLSDGSPFSNNTQPTAVVPVVGRVDGAGQQAFVYIGDYWTQPYTGDPATFWSVNPSPYVGMRDSKTVIAAISFPTDTTLVIDKPSTWAFDGKFIGNPSLGVGGATVTKGPSSIGIGY